MGSTADISRRRPLRPRAREGMRVNQRKGRSLRYAAVGALATLGMLAAACGGSSANASGTKSTKSTASTATTATTAPAKTYTIKWAVGQGKTGVVSKELQAAATTIEKKTNGGIQVDIYYSGQLGSNKAVMTQVMHNVAQMFTQDTNTMSSFWKTATFTDLPYLFTTATQAYSYWTSTPGKQELAAIQSHLGVRMLDSMGFGFHSVLSAVGPITGLTSFKTLKVCSPSSTTVNLFLSAVGAQEVVITTIPNAYTDAEQGLCHAILMGPASLVANKFTEVAKHFTFSRTSFQFAATWINTTFYKSLPSNYQQILQSALQKIQTSERAEIAGTTAATGTYSKQLAANGVTLSNLSSAGRAQIAAAVKAGVYSKVASTVGPTAAKWLTEWEAAKSK